jgi:DNA polymerase-4
MMEIRKIIHVDMDAFYASVEELDFPELRGKPVAVGGNAERGVVAAANYEARKFGVKSAMSSRLAAKKCPHLIFVKPRFERYKEISSEIRQIFQRYTDQIEPLSLDEAFLDVTFNKMDIKSATFIAQAIKNDIKNELNLIASAGVSYNKFLAKTASDQDKPDGLFIIRPKDGLSFIDTLPIGRFYGVGKVTEEAMKDLGISTGKDLRKLSLEFLTKMFGKSGLYFYQICRGIDHRDVVSNRERKSIGVENTFENDIFQTDEFKEKSLEILKELWERYTSKRSDASKIIGIGKTLNIKLKYHDFIQLTRSHTHQIPISDYKTFEKIGIQLINQVIPLPKPVRLIGFQISNFEIAEKIQQNIQLTLEF